MNSILALQRLLVAFPRLLSLLAPAALTATMAAGCANAGTPGSANGPEGSDSGVVLNGFDLSDASVPVEEIHRGGPPRDGIPSIDDPKFWDVERADAFLEDDDTVLSYGEGENARAYPFRILVWHEVVNDEVEGEPILPTYCPLCGTAMVFHREYRGQVLEFGVSGLLFNSDVLLYDRETESLWSQIGLDAVSGPMKGEQLKWLSSEQMRWAAWRERYPEGKVLSTETGYRRDYDRMPYRDYKTSPDTMFPYGDHRDDLSTKEWVAGVRIDDTAKAYPLDAIPTDEAFPDTIGGEPVRVRYDVDADLISVETADGKPVPTVRAYWFAWQAFYPETELWENNDEPTVGDAVPDVVLRTADGEALHLAETVSGQSTLLVFYRGGWCPFCNTQLSTLAEVEAELRERGIEILAISPDRPEVIRESQQNGDFSYRLLSDSDMEAARAFGIAFQVEEDLVRTYKEDHGIDLEAASGRTHHLLPHPAVYLVDPDGVIRHAHVNPDYRDRLSGEDLLKAAEALNR